jgi:hypothetical protein
VNGQALRMHKRRSARRCALLELGMSNSDQRHGRNRDLPSPDRFDREGGRVSLISKKRTSAPMLRALTVAGAGSGERVLRAPSHAKASAAETDAAVEVFLVRLGPFRGNKLLVFHAVSARRLDLAFDLANKGLRLENRGIGVLHAVGR